MFDEFFMEVFFIKIKVNGYLENKKNNSKEIIDTFGIKNKDNITYYYNDTRYKFNIKNNKLTLVRDNQDFTHSFIFELNKETKSEYYIKEFSTKLDVYLITTKLKIADNRIEINYKIKDTDDEYIYVLDLE